MLSGMKLSGSRPCALALLPHLGAVVISVTATALDRVSGVRVVCGDACVPGRGGTWRGLGFGALSRWVRVLGEGNLHRHATVGELLVLRLVREVRVRLSRVCSGSPQCF